MVLMSGTYLWRKVDVVYGLVLAAIGLLFEEEVTRFLRDFNSFCAKEDREARVLKEITQAQIRVEGIDDACSDYIRTLDKFMKTPDPFFSGIVRVSEEDMAHVNSVKKLVEENKERLFG